MPKIIYLAVGTLIGGICRYAMASGLHARFGFGFPYGTLAVNMLGCLIIGALGALAEGPFRLSPEARLLLITGFCGAFTTFSSFMLETSSLMKNGENVLALLYVIASGVGGFLIFKLGERLGGYFG